MKTKIPPKQHMTVKMNAKVAKLIEKYDLKTSMEKAREAYQELLSWAPPRKSIIHKKQVEYDDAECCDPESGKETEDCINPLKNYFMDGSTSIKFSSVDVEQYIPEDLIEIVENTTKQAIDKDEQSGDRRIDVEDLKIMDDPDQIENEHFDVEPTEFSIQMTQFNIFLYNNNGTPVDGFLCNTYDFLDIQDDVITFTTIVQQLCHLYRSGKRSGDHEYEEWKKLFLSVIKSGMFFMHEDIGVKQFEPVLKETGIVYGKCKNMTGYFLIEDGKVCPIVIVMDHDDFEQE
jgi:hypothetical protein